MSSFRCVASRDLSVNTERSWDVDAATRRILEWSAGSREKASRCFLAFDPDGEPTEPATYRLPFVDIVEGGPVAVAEALRTAASELRQTTDLGDDCRAQCRDVVDGYMDKIHDAVSTPEERSSSGIMLSRLPLDNRASRQPKTKDDLDEDLMAQIHDPSVITDGSLPYLNSAWGSTDLVDTYFTKMTPKTLQNYADDATNGIAMQNSHRVDELSLGRTYRGKYTAARGDKPGRAEMSFYIPPGLRVTDVSTDDVVRGIQWGTIKDVSVGFYGGNLRCSICGKAMLDDIFYIIFYGGDDDERDQVDPDAPCAHLPGVEYSIRDKQGNKTDQRAIAVGEIDDAHCAELSFVFDGATPQAQIRGRQAPVLAKATRMLECGVLSRRAAITLEHRYRSIGVRFPDLTTRRFSAATATRATDEPVISPPTVPPEPAAVTEPPAQEATPMPEPTEGTQAASEAAAAAAAAATAAERASHPPDPLPSLRTAMIRAGLVTEDWTGDAAALATRFAELGTEMADLRKWSDVGKKAREELVDRCKKMGIRAFGNAGLPEAAYGPILDRGSYEELTGLYQHLEAQAKERFPGGRATEDGGEPTSTNGTSKPIAVPLSAYHAGR